MFTLQEIKDAHAKVRSGADFPRYIQDLIQLGVKKYESYVSDGKVVYFAADNSSIESPSGYSTLNISSTGDTEKLKHALQIHQQGQTDYPTFCQQSAEAGVQKWLVDMDRMSCTYFDLSGNSMVVETIPSN